MIPLNWKQQFLFEQQAERYYRDMRRQTPKDQELFKNLLDEVNSHGYQIQYYFELNQIDHNDLCLVPVLMKYIGQFDNTGASSALMRYLAYPAFTEATELMLSEMRRTGLPKEGNQSESLYRQSASVALYGIRDPRYVDEYINLILDPETHDDCYFIILLLGKVKAEKAVPLLIELLNDPKSLIQSASLEAMWYFKNHQELIPYIEPFLQNDNKDLRRYAAKTIKKLTPKPPKE